MSDLFKKLLIIRTPKIGPVRYAEMIAKFGSVDAVVDFLNPDSDFLYKAVHDLSNYFYFYTVYHKIYNIKHRHHL